MRAIDKLRTYWGKRERDIMFHFPLGTCTKSDAHYLHSAVFPKEVTDELDRRGYDVTTLKFSIEPKQGNPKFASQREEKNDSA